MNGLLRLSDYDVFAYVASGFAALLVWDLASSSHYVLGARWTVAEGFLTIVAAYVIGQLLAAPSGFVIERQFVKRVLLRPTEILMGTREIGWRRTLKETILRDYYLPLDPGLRQRVLARAQLGPQERPSGEALFWQAFPVAKRDSIAYSRMESFLKLYGFCRNMAFVGITGAALLTGDTFVGWRRGGWSSEVVEEGRWAGVALLVGLGMLHRYLKFHRLYALEVFLTFGNEARYSEPKVSAPKGAAGA